MPTTSQIVAWHLVGKKYRKFQNESTINSNALKYLFRLEIIVDTRQLHQVQ
jgi:hypothetical protein